VERGGDTQEDAVEELVGKVMHARLPEVGRVVVLFSFLGLGVAPPTRSLPHRSGVRASKILCSSVFFMEKNLAG
jgi:hypothetical protein